MAGDWIKMRADLFTHPKVVRMASALKADTLRTVGGLMSAWCLFDAHSEDGLLEGYTPETLDAHVRWEGFSAAMQAVGWLEVRGESGLFLPRFDAHNGQSAKRRAQEADRKRDARKASALEADEKRTREEKRREDKKKPPNPRKRGKSFDASAVELPPWLPAVVWLAWVEYRAESGKRLTRKSCEQQLVDLGAWREKGHDPEAIIRTSIRNQWQGLFEPKGDAKAAPADLGGEAASAWGEVRAANQRGSAPQTWGFRFTARALESMGGFYALRDMTERDAQFKQRDFERAYTEAARSMQ
jgi:hypothetical protein